jgi:TnpA family transposase
MAEIHRWQYQYIGTSTFPKALSTVELQAFFTFTEDQIAALNKRFRANMKIGAAIQLGFLKMSGSLLESTQIIPSRLLSYVSKQLGLPTLTIATLRTIYKRPKTRYEHQWWAMEELGFTKATPRQLQGLLPFMRQEARYASSVDILVERAKLWLYQHQYLAVGDRTLRDQARKAMSETEEVLIKLIRDQASSNKLSMIDSAVLTNHPDTGRSYLEWLQQPPRKKSINALRERMERVNFLKSIGVDSLDLDSLPIEKIRAYAGQLYNIRPVKYKELKDPTRTIRLVCFLKLALMQATDSAILLGGRQITKIVRNAYEKARLLEAETIVTAAKALQEILLQSKNTDMSDQEFRAFVQSFDTGSKIQQFPTRAAAARWILSEPNPQIRSLLSELQKLDLQAEPEDPSTERVEYLREMYQHRSNELPVAPTVSIPSPWKDIIEGEDRVRALRGLEAATLIGLRKSLRSGAVYVEHSEKFRGRHRLMIDENQWNKERNKRYSQLGLPIQADDLLNTLVTELEIKLQEVDKKIAEGAIYIDNGIIHMPRVQALETKIEVNQKRSQLFDRIGVIQLPDLILEMDSRVGFSRILLGRTAKSPTELLQVYAGMLSHGSAMDASAISLMIPQLTPSQVLSGMQYFEDRDLVRIANDTVTSLQRNLPIATYWGDGALASSDMMSLDVSRKIWQARLDPKRKTPSIGTYTHVSDFWSVIYDQPIILNERQAGAAIEGAIRQREIEIDRLAVDTHGYTEFAMAMAKLLGFALCPRLKRLSERKLYIPSGFKNIPDSLREIATPSISLKQIRSEWDNLVRLASSIETGHTSATVALARYGSASSDSPIYRAGVHLGRLVRSLYLCDYFVSEDLRRVVNRILVHGEAVHTLQRAINAGSFSKPRGQREEDLYAVSGSLTLMTNLCLAWTAIKMQETIFGEDGMADAGEDMSWLQQVSPAHYANINFRGTFTFPISEYALWLLSDNAPSQKTG